MPKKPYKWEYLAEGNMIICHDNQPKSKGVIQAICVDSPTAIVFVEILNAARDSENIL